MSASGFTPIQLYRSSTAATLPVAGNLAPGELAINTTDEKLYFENTGGTVTLLASSAAAGGTFTTVTATTVVNGLGAVGTPSYTFTGDLNTGMWSPAADTVAVSTAGSERLRVDSTGSVQLGTFSGTSPRLLVYDNDTTDASIIARQDGTAPIQIWQGLGAAEAMRITSAANVGLGTAAPSAKLDVAAAAFTGGPLIGARYNTANFRMGIGIANANGFPFVGHNVNNSADDNGTFDLNGRASRLRMDSGTFQFETSSASGTAGNAITWNNSAYLSAAGNLGLGTTTPDLSTYRTFIQDSANPSVFMQRLNGIEEFSIYSDSGITAFNTPTNPMTFATSGIERMRISSAGNVGIGTSTPGTILDVRSAAGSGPFLVLVNTSATANTNVIETSYTFNNNNTGSATAAVIGATNPFAVGNSYGDIYFKTTNPTNGLTEKMRIDSVGDVSIAATAGLFSSANRGNLTIGGSSSSILVLGTGVGTAAYLYSDRGTSQCELWNLANGYMRFGTNNTERLRITAAGDVGIGTTAPTTGSMSNVAILSAGLFSTNCGSVASTSGVAVTLGAATLGGNETYIVSVGIYSGAPTVYSAVSIVSADAGVLRTTALQTASLMTISVSGTNIRATQASGGSANIVFSITRVA